MGHNGIGDDGEDEEEGHHQQNGSEAVEIVAAELLEIYQEQAGQYCNIGYAPPEAGQTLLRRQGMLLLMLLPGVQDAHHLLVNYLSAVHNLLPLQHDALGAHQATVYFLPLLLALLTVIGKVGLHVFHEVEPVQTAMAEACAVLFMNKIFVGSLLCEELAEAAPVRLIVMIDAHHFRLLVLEMCHVLG